MRLGTDVGGTFTDFVLLDSRQDGVGVGKLLTTPDDPSRAVLEGTEALTSQNGVQIRDVHQFVHGTTLVTNTIIERKGARTGLIATRGFRDALEIGREIRYDMYDLFIERPEPIVPRFLRLEVGGRLAADGTLLRELDLTEVDQIVRAFDANNVEAVAVSLLHAFRNTSHEQQVRSRLRQLAPQLHVSLSSDVCPEIREYDRTSTTVANAYVQPIVSRYLGRLDEGMRTRGFGEQISIMLSSGGINTVDYAKRMPVQMVESGPAGGAMAASFIGRRAGIDRLLAFDMGGTTAKLCLVEDGVPHRATMFEAARIHRFMKGSGLVMKIPVIEMIEIGAGGGSIARADRLGTLKVGPQSASAVPGPACYAHGGIEPTVTDADLIMGFLDPEYFLGGRMRLDRDRATNAVANRLAKPLGIALLKAARGIFEVVNENMATAARVYFAERGRDPRQYTMLAFGGAGPVHAWDLARRLKIKRLLCPPAAGAASALGFLVTPPTVDLATSHVSRLESFSTDTALALINRLEREAAAILGKSGVPQRDIRFDLAAEMRYVGQGHEIPVPITFDVLQQGANALKAAFDAEYEQVFGRAVGGVPAELVTWRLRGSGPEPAAEWGAGTIGGHVANGKAQKGRRPAYFDNSGKAVEALVFDRYLLGPGAEFHGPSIVEERESTVIVPPGARATIDPQRNLLIEFE
jgi:N-methylhydantoinase A